LGGWAGLLAAEKGQPQHDVWQIDPDLCIACDRCETECVLDVSPVKAVQCYELCARCDDCTGYFGGKDYKLNTGVENQRCPTGAVLREFIREKGGVRYFEYNIDEALCIGCGKCVEGCAMMNGSLYLQVRHDRCLNCNECAIAVVCPAQAFRRVPRHSPNLLKKKARKAIEAYRLKQSGGSSKTPLPQPSQKGVEGG